MLTFKCNVCSSTTGKDLLTIHKPDRFEKALGVKEKGYKRKWVLCEQCGIAVNCMSRESLEAVNNVASSYYEIDLGGESELQQRFDFIMDLPEYKSDNAGRVDRILNYLSKHESEFETVEICDVGCGLGVFPSKVMEVSGSYGLDNIRITGIEPDSTSYNFAKNLNQFSVVQGFFPEVVKGKKFDLITLNKVLEHISDPADMMRSVEEHLKEHTGLTYVEVPCITNAWLKPPDDNSLGALHCNLYSINSLSSLLEKVGLTTVLAERIFEPSGKISIYVIAQSV